MKEFIYFTLLSILVLASLIFAPLLLIWSLNTLFSLNIGYTFWTWLAAFVFGSFLVSFKNNKS